MEKFKNSKAIALVSTALFVASLFWLMKTKSVNGSLEAGLNEEKLKSEQLLSEKLLLEKDLDKIKGQLSELSGKNRTLDDLVKATTEKLRGTEAEYSHMKKENMSLARIKKERQELQEIQSRLQNDLSKLRIDYANMEADNSELRKAVATLEERNNLLSRDLGRAMLASLQQTEVNVLKGKNDRLTVKAKRARKLVANFDVPADLKNVSFRIRDAKEHS